MSIWIAIHPGKKHTRIIATSGINQTLLKANLATRANHPRALPTLLEALALWQGTKVHAALVADERANTSGTNLFTDCFDVVEPTPLFEFAIVAGLGPQGRPERIRGMGNFRDLRKVLVERVRR